MSYAPNPYPSQSPYTPPGGDGAPERRNLGLIGAIVVGCTVIVLGSVLLVTFLATRAADPSNDGDVAAGDETSVEGDEVDTDGGDHEDVAVAIARILYGVSDESSDGLVCSDPGTYLADVDATGATVREFLGEEYSGLIEDIVATDSTVDGASAEVTVALVVYGVETDLGTVELVMEDGEWKACDFIY